MHIGNFEIKEQVDTMEVSADIDGFRLWFRLPKAYQVSRAADPFLASALHPAMLQGEKLEIDPHLPVSPKLLENVIRIQEIFHTWNPKELKLIPVSATTSSAEPLNTGVMSFFSGGVDSTYTFLKRINEISHVVNIHGFDFYFNSRGTSRFTVEDLKDLAQFAYKLMQPSDSVSAYVKGMLSNTTLQALSNYRESRLNPGKVEAALVEDLNRIIAVHTIYEAQRFASVKLRPKTSKLLARDLQCEDREGLNRLLLEDAYPLEIARRDSSIDETAITRNANFARSFGKVLIPVATNHFAFGYRYNLSRNLSQGGALASVALLLGFPRVFVPSSYSYKQLFPLGSHPLTDRLWANEAMEIIHDGSEARRVDKIQKIAKDGHLLANLRVCFNDMNVNCGKCLKCLRTMIPLKLLQAGTGPFPPLPSSKVIRKMRIAGAIEKSFFNDNLDLALQSGDAELRDALQACLRRHERLELLKNFDRVILGGLIKRTHRAITNAVSGIQRVDTTNPGG
jgi:hypothetical protein